MEYLCQKCEIKDKKKFKQNFRVVYIKTKQSTLVSNTKTYLPSSSNAFSIFAFIGAIGRVSYGFISINSFGK